MRARRSRAATPSASSSVRVWLRTQRVNSSRHLRALRPFRRDEFGTGPAAPTEAHIQSANELIRALRAPLTRHAAALEKSIAASRTAPVPARLRTALADKERVHESVRAVERVWDFYFELFGQRQSRFGQWLLSCDRIALDCYQKAYMNVGTAKSIPAPPPFSYMRTGFSPATFRRDIPLRRLGRQLNPFPLIELPYHRLVNPWTLGAVLHEVCHNLHSDLGLSDGVPRAIRERLASADLPPAVIETWTRWNRETFADMGGLLLGGPAIVASLFDVIGRAPASVTSFDDKGPHPTPYLRAFLSIELLSRMGFREDASRYSDLWNRLYAGVGHGTIPESMIKTFPRAMPLVVDAICFTRFPALGGKRLVDVFRFEPKDQVLIAEAGRRLAKGTDPGVVPERFLIGAARFAVDNELAPPEDVARAFYAELARR